MALLECPECKQEVAERDYFCIECGYPRSGMSANKSPARPDRSFEATHPRLATAAKNKRLEATAAAKQERLAAKQERLAAEKKRLEAAAAAKQSVVQRQRRRSFVQRQRSRIRPGTRTPSRSMIQRHPPRTSPTR